MERFFNRIRYRPTTDPSSARYNPDTAWLLLACIISGIGQSLAEISPSITDALGIVISWIWVASLLIFGLLCFVSLYLISNRVLGLILERAGRYELCAVGVIYSILVIAENGSKALVPSIFIGGFAIGCAFRAAHITMWLHQVKVLRAYAD